MSHSAFSFIFAKAVALSLSKINRIMKKYTLFLLLILAPIFASAQLTYVPDVNFEQALIDLGYDSPPLDNYVPTANIEGMITLPISSKGINDLTGIEDFTSLQILYAAYNNLSSIDLSQNLNLRQINVGSNQLSAIDVSQNTLLSILYCDANALTSLNLSQNAQLTELYCDANSLSQLDISQNPLLEKIFCANNMLSSLNTAANPNLLALYCYGNNISSLNISQNTHLEFLYCYANELNALDVSQNTQLKFLLAAINQIPNIDLYNNIDLTHLDLTENNLNSIDISNNLSLENLNLSNNNLSELDATFNDQLKEVIVYNNQIDALDLSNAQQLIYLLCDSNQLESFNIKNGNNTNISGFSAQNNPNLECIEVDDPVYSEANWPDVDPEVEFSEDCNPLNIEEEEFESLHIYPNPFSNEIFMKTNQPVSSIEILNVLGVSVYKSNAMVNSINLSGLSQGVYILKATFKKMGPIS